MAKHSALFRYYKQLLERCSSADELLQISREISTNDFSGPEKIALMVSCTLIAEEFDKKGQVVYEVS